MFDCRGERLLGILHPSPGADTAVLVIVGGPQYRAGSHRQFVQLARALSGAGYAVMRFDYRGMGDSGGTPQGFERVSDDIASAIDALQQRLPEVRHVVLWGLCDGASAALMYCDDRRDPRVRGVCALNPWVRSEASLASTQLKHYYTQRLVSAQFWAKLLRGQVAAGALKELGRKLRAATTASSSSADAAPADFRQRMARGWQRAGGRILLILSGNDYTAKEFIEHAGADKTWRTLLAQPRVRRHTVDNADHTFSDEASRLAAERLTIAWLRDQRFAIGS
jgi:exosortase A-associated hydrolase 1